MKIETKFTEDRYFTKEPEKMIGRFIASRVLKSWIDDFVDEDTAEVVSIERNEVLFDRGILIDQEILQQLQFCIQSGDITSVEVSNQRRLAYPTESTTLRPYMATVMIGTKNYKFLLYALSADNVFPILTDYVELNYTSPFCIRSVKDFSASLILVDNLQETPIQKDVDVEYLTGAVEKMNGILQEHGITLLDVESYKDEPELPSEEKKEKKERKYYDVDFSFEIDGERVSGGRAIVQTFNVDRAMMLIGDYMIKQERERVNRQRTDGLKVEMRELTFTLEAAKPLTLEAFIPKEFSQAYVASK